MKNKKIAILLFGCSGFGAGRRRDCVVFGRPEAAVLYPADICHGYGDGIYCLGKKAEAAVEAAIAEVNRLDALLSTGSAASEISQINAEGGGEMSADTAAILERAMEIYDRTEGRFDFTIYPLMQLWGFTSGEYHVPSAEELEEALPLVDASRVRTDGDTVTLGKGQEIDFGGIAKGYTSDRVMEIFREYGISSGIVSLGGNVQVLDTKTDGTKWRIGIRNPIAGGEGIIASVQVENQAVITSGGYERYFEEDGNTYIHILNPETGYPADSGLLSVTVISPDGMLADALSTSLYLMGAEGAADFWREQGDAFELVLVDDQKNIYVTEGMADSFQSDEKVQLITKE